MEEEWDPTLRREQRRDLRHIIQDVHKHREELSMPDDLVRHIHRINSVFERVVSTREAAIDAEGFLLLSSIGKEQAESSAGELVFDPVIFSEKLVTLMGGRRGDGSHHSSRELNWAKLGEKAQSCFQTAPSLTFLNGALDLAPIVKKQRQIAGTKKKDTSDAKVTKPKELAAFEDEEESTTKDVAHIFKHLKMACSQSSDRVHYFSFLIDPDSFSHTVENFFHFAFLVKDGRAGIMIDPKNHQPYIHLPESSVKSEKSNKAQIMFSLSIQMWERAKEKFRIFSASIPPRQD